jgi:hypothetical protein
MALPFSPIVNKPTQPAAVSPDTNPFAQSQEIHPPNWAQRTGDALLIAALAVLPEAYKGVQLRQGSYIDSDANIVFRESVPGTGTEVILFEQREGGTIGYVFDNPGAAAADLAEVAFDVAGEAAIL